MSGATAGSSESGMHKDLGLTAEMPSTAEPDKAVSPWWYSPGTLTRFLPP